MCIRDRGGVGRGHADVVDQQLLRELRAAVRVAGPVAADRQVQDQEERVVVHPPVAVQVRGGAGLVDVAVHRPADLVGRPVDRERVEAVGEVRPAVARADAAGTRVAGAVDRAVDGVGLEADVLHDVDLARVGPADAADVVAEHPERGPHALAARELHARLEVAVGLGEPARRVQPRRGVLAAAVPAVVVRGVFLAGGDDEVARAVGRRVARAVRVHLALVVVDVVTRLRHPLAAVHGRTRGAVELVGERRRHGADRAAVGRADRGGAVGGRGHGDRAQCHQRHGAQDSGCSSTPSRPSCRHRRSPFVQGGGSSSNH